MLQQRSLAPHSNFSGRLHVRTRYRMRKVTRIMHILRWVIPAVLVVALSACSGSGGLGNIFGPQGNPCIPGTAVQMVSPTPNQFNSNVSSVTIVASGDTDNIHPNPGSWSVFVQSSFATINGGGLNPVPDPGAPHPFTSDFYYQSQLQQTLPPGATWTVDLQQNTGCAPVAIATFST